MVTEKLTPRVGDVWRFNVNLSWHVFIERVAGNGVVAVTCTESGKALRRSAPMLIAPTAFSPHLKPRRTGFTLVRRDGVEVQP